MGLVGKFNWMFFVLFGLTVVEVEAAVFTAGPEVGAGTTGFGQQPKVQKAMDQAAKMISGASDRGGRRLAFKRDTTSAAGTASSGASRVFRPTIASQGGPLTARTALLRT